MKVVIAPCIGGFCPSVELMKRLIALQSDCIKTYDFDKNDVPDWNDEPLADVGDGFYLFDWPNTLTDNKVLYGFSWKDKHRVNPDLVSIVEELGSRAAESGYELSIVEIPNDIQWHIASNEMGVEYVVENHRTWFAEKT